MLPQSASGGCTPRPRKLSAAMNRNVKQKRRPNSAVSGGTALGRISRVMIHHQPSPRNCAASTNSRLTSPTATERARRKTLVESSTAMVTISTGSPEPRTDRMTKAKISVGIESSRSTSRDSAWSTQPPATAAAKPLTMPMKNDSAVMTSDEADRHARAIDQPAEQVAPEIVEPEPVLPVRVRPGVAEHRGLVVGRDRAARRSPQRD